MPLNVVVPLILTLAIFKWQGNHDLTFDVVNYDALGRRFHRRMLDCNALRVWGGSFYLKACILNGRQQQQPPLVPLSQELVIEQCTYLEDSACEIEGVSFYGAPWQPWFGDWGFNLERGEPCAAKWRMIPAGVDVLITHGPPLGHGDLTSSDERAGTSGSVAWEVCPAADTDT